MTAVFFWFSQASYISYITPTLRDMGATATFIGLVGGVYGFVQFLVRIPLGIIADRFYLHKKIIIVGTLVASFSSLGIFFVFEPAGFLVFRALAGAGATTWMFYYVTYASYFGNKKTTNATSIMNSAHSGGVLAGLLFVGIAASFLNVRYALLLATAAGIIAFIISLSVKPPQKPAESLNLRKLLNVFTNKHLIVVSFLALTVRMMSTATNQQFTPDLAKNLGAGKFNLALSNMIFTGVLVITAIFAGKYLIAKFGNKKLLCTGFILFAIYAIGIVFSENLFVLFIFQTIGGVGEGLTFPILAGLSIAEFPHEKRASAIGVFSAIYGLGMTLGPIFMGYIIDSFGYISAFASMSAVSLLAFLVSLIFIKKNKK